MTDLDITEGENMQVDEVHLVPVGANNFPVLLLKSTQQALAGAAKDNTEKKGTTVSKLTKRLKKESIRSVNIAGAGSTAPSKLSDSEAARLLADATGQGSRPNGAGNQGAYGTTAILKAMNRRVEKANKKLVKAAGDYERTAAKAEFESAARQRLLSKLIAQANRQKITRTGTRFGPDSTDLFSGSSLSLPDDAALHGLSTGRPA